MNQKLQKRLNTIKIELVDPWSLASLSKKFESSVKKIEKSRIKYFNEDFLFWFLNRISCFREPFVLVQCYSRLVLALLFCLTFQLILLRQTLITERTQYIPSSSKSGKSSGLCNVASVGLLVIQLTSPISFYSFLLTTDTLRHNGMLSCRWCYRPHILFIWIDLPFFPCFIRQHHVAVGASLAYRNCTGSLVISGPLRSLYESVIVHCSWSPLHHL